MATIIRDPILEERILAERAERGGDRYDEVWDGVYIMPPMPNDEHQMLVGRFTRILDEIVGDAALGHVRPGVNVSDRVNGWQQNYRVPDVAVFLNDTRAVNYAAFWHGGPDLAIEILSPGDQARDKLEFYAQVKTREVLVVDRAPWQIELYRLKGGRMDLIGTSTLSHPLPIHCNTVPAEIQLVSAEERPRILINHLHEDRSWLI
ncbi:MAG: Uma2 family endonuclease [Planctomycetales bacterium]|nr:Uma2 family endonuclease [Planctomycetales bacterium]